MVYALWDDNWEVLTANTFLSKFEIQIEKLEVKNE